MPFRETSWSKATNRRCVLAQRRTKKGDGGRFVKCPPSPLRILIAHSAEHDVTTEEFEEVVTNPECEDVSRSTGNPAAFGWTSTGRHLCCVFKWLGDDLIEPVTAYNIGE